MTAARDPRSRPSAGAAPDRGDEIASPAWGGPDQELRLTAARRWSNRMVRLVATGVGVLLLMVAVFTVRRAPLSGAVVGAVAVGILLSSTWVPLRLPVAPRSSRDPAAPGVLFPGSRPHPGVVAGHVVVLLLLVLGTALPAVALVRDPGLGAAVLTAVGVGACAMTLLSLRAVGRAGQTLLVGPRGLTIPGLGADPVPWDRVTEVAVASTYERRGIPQHVPVVRLRMRSAGPTHGRLRAPGGRPRDRSPARVVQVLERLVRGSVDRSVLGTEVRSPCSRPDEDPSSGVSVPTSPRTG